MMKVAALAVLGSVLIVACGSSPPPAASPPPGSEPSPEADASSPVGSASAAPSARASEPASVADAGAAPATDPKSGAPVGEMKDECTPVGVDFEKRARPKLKECYAVAKKKAPNLEGTITLKITVDVKGKIKATKVVDKTLPDSVADCMLKVIRTTPFPEVDKCWDATLTIPLTFPTPK